jgi:hypothetical protein
MERRTEIGRESQREALMLGLIVEDNSYGDESLPAYLHRLAEANALSGVFLTERFKSEICSAQGMKDLVGEMDVRWRDIARELAAPQTRPMPMWNLRRRRFCRKCLAEKSYWRISWDLSLVTCCIKHKVPLRDTCRHCGSPLDWTEHITTSCPACGGDLADTGDVGEADSSEVWLVRELQHAFATDSRRASHLRHLSYTELHELVFRIGACASRPKARKPLKIAESGSVATASAICASAAVMLRRWPSGFAQGLDRIQMTREAGKTWKLVVALGPIYREIFDGLLGRPYQFIRDAIESYLLRKWEAPLALRHRRLHADTVTNHGWLSVEEAAHRVDLPPAIVSRAAALGEVCSRSQIYPNGRIARVVDISSLQSIAMNLRRSISVKEAACKLGLSKRRVVQLIDANFLKVWGGKPVAGTAWFIERSGVEDLLRPGSNAPLCQEILSSQVSFAQLMRCAARGDKTFNVILEATFTGTISVAGMTDADRRICDWIFERVAVKSLLNSSAFTSASEVNIVEAARILGVKQEVIYALVRQRVIKSRMRRINGRQTRFVRLADLAAFRKSYVFGSELATSLNCSPKTMAKVLYASGIVAFGGPTLAKRPCRQYYWRRSPKLDEITHLQLRKNGVDIKLAPDR